MASDNFIKDIQAAARCIHVRNYMDPFPEHTIHPMFTAFQTWSSQCSNKISYTTWGMSMSYTIWEVYGLTTDVGVKKAIFSWWLSQQPAPIEG
jgi:hypothetical protein